MEQARETTSLTDKNREWSPKDLVTIVPLVATSFAFAFVVGYFFAFDISWFPFFSLSEHIVFALRALPVAVGAAAFFLIALTHPIESRRWHLALTLLWIVFLGGQRLQPFFTLTLH